MIIACSRSEHDRSKHQQCHRCEALGFCFQPLVWVQQTSTANEGGCTIHDTTYEVDYAAIILQKSMKWFMEGVADLDSQDVHFPEQSHGFSTVLANVHRAHPRISTAYALSADA